MGPESWKTACDDGSGVYVGQVKAIELQHDPAEATRPVQAGKTVIPTARGEQCAEIRRPLLVVQVTPEELRASEVSDEAILAALAEARE